MSNIFHGATCSENHGLRVCETLNLSSEKTRMTDSPEIIAGLLKLKDLTNEVHDRLHDQEHLWEACEYPKLEHKWDKANRDIWDDIHHKFLRRIFALGGRPNGVKEDPATASPRASQGFE